MSTMETRTNYLTAPDSDELPLVLAPHEIEDFQRQCQEQNLTSFAGIIYFEGRELSVRGLVRKIGVNPVTLARPDVLAGPYVMEDYRTGELVSYSGIMLYAEANTDNE